MEVTPKTTTASATTMTTTLVSSAMTNSTTVANWQEEPMVTTVIPPNTYAKDHVLSFAITKLTQANQNSEYEYYAVDIANDSSSELIQIFFCERTTANQTPTANFYHQFWGDLQPKETVRLHFSVYSDGKEQEPSMMGRYVAHSHVGS